MAKRTPVPYEAALSIAEDWARHWLIDNSTEGHIHARWKVINGVLMPPAGDRPLINDENQQADYDDEKAKPLIDRALHEHDADADAALCEIIFRHLLHKRELPENLRVFLMVLMRDRFEQPPKRDRGTPPNKFLERNTFIVGMVALLHRLGISPTRNREPRNNRPCGCSIVADALTRIGKPTTERAVEEVWISRDVPPDSAKRAE